MWMTIRLKRVRGEKSHGRFRVVMLKLQSSGQHPHVIGENVGLLEYVGTGLYRTHRTRVKFSRFGFYN